MFSVVLSLLLCLGLTDVLFGLFKETLVVADQC